MREVHHPFAYLLFDAVSPICYKLTVLKQCTDIILYVHTCTHDIVRVMSLLWCILVCMDTHGMHNTM